MNLTIGTHELRTIQRAMQLYTKLIQLAAEKDVRLPQHEEAELVTLTKLIHNLVYEEKKS